MDAADLSLWGDLKLRPRALRYNSHDTLEILDIRLERPKYTMNSDSVAKRKCMGADCDNDAGTLQCPTCLKLGIKDSFFCAQDCFKRNWVSLLFIPPYLRTSPKLGKLEDPQTTFNISELRLTITGHTQGSSQIPE